MRFSFRNILLLVLFPATVSYAQFHHFTVQKPGGGDIPVQTAGMSFFIEVLAKDSTDAPVTTFTGTVDISSTGTLIQGAGTTPPFVSGVLTGYGVMFSQTGSFTITATHTSGTETGTSNAFTVNPGQAARLVIQIEPPGTTTAGAAFSPQPVIRVEDNLGNLVSTDNSTAVTASVQSGTGGLLGTLVATAAGGIAAFTNLSYRVAETITIGFAATNLTGAVSTAVQVVPAAPAKVQVETSADGTGTVVPSQNVAMGTSLLMYPVSRDTYGNYVSTSPARWSLVNSTGGIVPSDLIPAGDTRSAVFTGHIVGTTQVRAASGTLDSIPSGTLSVTPGAARQLSFTQQPTNDTAGTIITPAINVQVKDSLGNDVHTSGVVVTIALTTGAGTLSGTLTRLTNGSGTAAFTDVSIDKVGTKVITASGGSLISAVSNSFVIWPSAPVQLLFVQQPSSTTAGALITPAPSVQLLDAFGNNVPLAGVPVTVSVSSGTDTLYGTTTRFTDGTGLSTFTDLNLHQAGTKTISAASPSTTPVTSSSFIVSPASPTRVSVETKSDGTGIIVPVQTITSGNSIVGYAVTRDTFSNFIANPIATWSLDQVQGGVVGADLVPFNGNRAARFTGHAGGSAVIKATRAALTPVTSGTITVVAGAVKRLAFLQEPTATVAGNAISPAISVQLKDSLGNNAPVSGVSVQLQMSGGTGSLNGTTARPTDGSGLAVFNDISINLTGPKTLIATSGSLTPDTSVVFTIAPGAAAVLVFVQQPQNDTAGTLLNPPSTVQVQDIFGNNVPRAGDTISMSLIFGTGTLSGTASQLTNAAGLATFNDLVINQTGSKQLRASHTGYASAVSNSFTLTGYTITATANPHGSITPSGTLSFIFGASQTFTISPDTGYHTANVLVDGVSQGALPTYTFSNISANHTISAAFAVDTLIITAHAGPNGSIAPQGSVKVTYGANQSFAFTPAAGYHVLTLAVDDTMRAAVPSWTFTRVIKNHTITVNFAPDSLSIAASAGPNGTISPSGNVKVAYDSSKTFAITPNQGYHVFDVLVDGASVGRATSYTFPTVTGNHSISASFAIDTLTITASTGLQGSISPTGQVRVLWGSNQTFIITPDPTYHVSDVVVDGISAGPVVTYTFIHVTANHAIIASFTINGYTVTATAGPHGAISPSGSIPVVQGASLAFTFVPDTGYHVDSVFVDGAFVGAPPGYTLNSIASNHTISVKFAIDRFSITAISGEHGAISPSGVISADYGSSRTFTFLPDTGYHIDSVIVNGAYKGSPPSYTLANITAPQTIRVTFAINLYRIVATAGSNGRITPPDTSIVSYGGSLLYAIRPDTGYHVLDVLVDGVSAGARSSYTFTNVRTDHTIHAEFTPNLYAVLVRTVPDSLHVLVDGVLSTSPGVFMWEYHSAHTIAAVDTQSRAADIRYLYTRWSDGAGRSHGVTIIKDSAFTAFYRPQYLVTVNADTGGLVTPPSNWQDSGRVVTLRAYPDVGYKFSQWRGTGAGSTSDTLNPVDITVNSPITETARFVRFGLRMTVQTNPPGLTIIVDDTTYTSPKTFSWLAGSQHTIATADTQSNPAGIRSIWNGWSDGGARIHSVAPVGDTVFTATFLTQYYLTMSAGAGGNVTPQSGWFAKGQSVEITAIPGSNYIFTGWGGTGNGSVSGPGNPASVTMNGPISEIANFSRKPVRMTVGTNPTGLLFTFNDTTYAVTRTVGVVPGTKQSIGAPSPQPGSSPDIQWVWSIWSDSGAQVHDVFPATDTVFTAGFKLRYALTTAASPQNAGIVTPADKTFFTVGDTVLVQASASPGYLFNGWSGAITGMANPTTVVMDTPKSITANFMALPRVIITSMPAGRKITADDSVYGTPTTFTWNPGSVHKIGTFSPQSDTTGVRFFWRSWSDNGDTAHFVTASSDTVFTADFSTQYSLTMNSTAGGTVSPSSGWHDQGDTVAITATPIPLHILSRWEGTGAGAYSGQENPALVVVLSPVTETAIFGIILTPPSLAGIPDNAQGIPTDPTLCWHPYPNATSYSLQVSVDSTFADTAQFVFQSATLQDTSVQLSGLANFKTYYWRVRVSVGVDMTSYSSTSKFTTLNATITAASPPMSWATTYTYKIPWSTTDLSGNVNITLSLDSGKSFVTLKSNIPNSGLTEWTVPELGRVVDSCKLRIESSRNTDVYGESGFFRIVPGTLPARILLSASIHFPADPVSSTDYRLFSAPGIADTISMDGYSLGTQKFDWRMFADNGAPEDNLVEFSGTTPLRTGEGYWLIKRGNFDLTGFDMIMPRLSSDATLSIGLHAGWNIIGSPFDKSVPWQQVLTANNLPGTTQLTGYAGSYVPSTTLEPFQGYYFFNDSGLTALKVPYPFGSTLPERAGPAFSWRVRLTFESDMNRDAENYIGVSPAAASGRDSLDGHKPPLFQNQGFLYFPRPEWDKKYSRFNSDIRPAVGGGQVWEFEVSNPRKSAGRIRFAGIDQIPVEYRAILVNMLNSTPFDLRTHTDYSYQTVSPKMQFQVIVGTKEFVERELALLVPATIDLVQNFPNPFNSSTTIIVRLPHQADIRLIIYDALGRRVMSLADGGYPEGIHTFLWDGTDSRGLPVASGVYFSRLTTSDNSINTKKMMLLR